MIRISTVVHDPPKYPEMSPTLVPMKPDEDRRDYAHQERLPRAEHELGENVLAVIRGAEQMLRRGAVRRASAPSGIVLLAHGSCVAIHGQTAAIARERAKHAQAKAPVGV